MVELDSDYRKPRETKVPLAAKVLKHKKLFHESMKAKKKILA